MRNEKESIKVLIVDDSAFMRKILSDMLSSDPNITIVGIARNGQEAIQKIQLLNPDIVTMDVEMPIMNGLDALKKIMEIAPLPVVMLSSLTSEGANATILALESGAVDFIQKPTSVFSINVDAVRNELIEKIKVGARINFKKQCNSTINKTVEVQPNVVYKKEFKPQRTSTTRKPIVAIGTSTGGPRALQSVIPLIPANVGASFLIVQHMPAGFTKSLATRLNSISQVTVKEAEDGEKILPSTVYIAPGDFHLKVKNDRNGDLYIQLTSEAPVSGHRPSVDAMYQSLSSIKDRDIIGVIMTGMGADGAKGLKLLKDERKAFVIAQSEETCVVYGMPKSAVKLGVVDEIISLESITKSILNRLEVL